MRGLDYYCHTCFEFVSVSGESDRENKKKKNALGAQQSTVLAGGRYDGLYGVRN